MAKGDFPLNILECIVYTVYWKRVKCRNMFEFSVTQLQMKSLNWLTIPTEMSAVSATVESLDNVRKWERGVSVSRKWVRHEAHEELCIRKRIRPTNHTLTLVELFRYTLSLYITTLYCIVPSASQECYEPTSLYSYDHWMYDCMYCLRCIVAITLKGLFTIFFSIAQFSYFG